MQDNNTKICTKCGKEKPLTIDHFSRRSKTGYWNSWCRPCSAEYAQRLRDDNPDKYNALARASRQRNHASVIERGRKHYRDNRETIRAKSREKISFQCQTCGANFDGNAKVYRRGGNRKCEKCRNSNPHGTPEERFWKKVNKQSGLFYKRTQCWLWTGASVPKGYGKFQGQKGLIYAHIYSWESVNGPVPDGLLVLHRCDRPACVREAHLFTGTYQDNVDDMIAKGRARWLKSAGPENRSRL